MESSIFWLIFETAPSDNPSPGVLTTLGGPLAEAEPEAEDADAADAIGGNHLVVILLRNGTQAKAGATRREALV